MNPILIIGIGTYPVQVLQRTFNSIIIIRIIIENVHATAECNFNLATAYNEYGDSVNALKHFKDALAIDHDNVEIILNMAAIQEKAGELEEAHTLFKRALVIDSTNLTATEGKKRMEEQESAKADKNSWAIIGDTNRYMS